MSHILLEKPHSLSYQAEILPMLFPTTFVRDASTIADAELWLKSTETSFSFVKSKTFSQFTPRRILKCFINFININFFFFGSKNKFNK